MRKIVLPLLSAAAILSGAACAQMDDMLGGGSAQSSRSMNDRGMMSLAEVNPTSLVGKTVMAANGDTIGEVDDVLLRRGNRPSHVVVSSGGFMGLGAKNVALDADDLRYSTRQDAIVSRMSRDQVASMPEFRYDGSLVSLNRSRGTSGAW